MKDDPEYYKGALGIAGRIPSPETLRQRMDDVGSSWKSVEYVTNGIIICDNHSAHKSKEVQNYLAEKPENRFVFVFTPTHGSWLNLDVEGNSRAIETEIGRSNLSLF